MFSECLLVILNLLPFCWLSIILLSSVTFPLIPTQDMAEEGGILQPALAHSQYHYGEQCCFHPPPCWDCLACCRGHSRDSSPSPGWEGTEVIPSAWIGSGREQLRMWLLHAAESIENLSKESRQFQSVILATGGVQVQFKQSPRGRQCGVCLQQVPWVKHTDYKSTCSITE